MTNTQNEVPASDEHRHSPSDLGAHIRLLRKMRGWKLKELSERTGIALSTLSKVETGALSLNYDRLQMVARGFELSLSEFLSDPSIPKSAAASRVSWARHDSGKVEQTPTYQYRYLCTDLRGKTMQPIISQVLQRTIEDFGPLLSHEGEEFVIVTKGIVAVHRTGYEPEILQTGEGVYIDSRHGHGYTNAGTGDAEIVSINTQ